VSVTEKTTNSQNYWSVKSNQPQLTHINIMNMGIDPSWLAAGGALALVAGFWDKLRAMIYQCSKVMVVSMDMDHATSSDVVRYMRAHYEWVQFSDFNVRSVPKTRLDNGLTVWVPFKTPVANGLYKGPHGWVWMSSWTNATQLRAIRGTFNFLQLVKDANEYDNSIRLQDNPQRFYIHKVLGSEKGAWALGEALRESKNDPSVTTNSQSAGSGGKSVSEDAAFGIRVFEDLDKSFIYAREVYTRTGKIDPFKGLFFNDDALKEVDNARAWMRMGKWYAERSIPHRRGLMIYGPGGTGKSSYAKALAESLGIPVYQFFLNTLSDQEFIREWSQMSTPCVALLEDFDNVFHGRVPQTEHKALTFDAVLNQISGVSSLNGVYLIVTTNHIDLIDPAMGVSREGPGGISTRPGRIDRVLFMGNAPEEQRRRIAAHILKDWPDAVDDVVAKTSDMTPAQVQEVCTQLAYERLTV
jgi:hypothetical protein